MQLQVIRRANTSNEKREQWRQGTSPTLPIEPNVLVVHSTNTQQSRYKLYDTRYQVNCLPQTITYTANNDIEALEP